MWLMQYLFDPHHGFHVLGGVPHRLVSRARPSKIKSPILFWRGGRARLPHRQTAETAIPAHQVVVDVASHQAKHVAKIWLMLGNDGRGNPCRSHRYLEGGPSLSDQVTLIDYLGSGDI